MPALRFATLHSHATNRALASLRTGHDYEYNEAVRNEEFECALWVPERDPEDHEQRDPAEHQPCDWTPLPHCLWYRRALDVTRSPQGDPISLTLMTAIAVSVVVTGCDTRLGRRAGHRADARGDRAFLKLDHCA